MIRPHGLPAPEGLIEGGVVLDIGAGIIPMNWYKPKRHICVEPHLLYGEQLLAHGYEVWHTTALEALTQAEPGAFDAIYMLDVLEHMPKYVGRRVLTLAKHLRPKQIVIATPEGFHQQDTDEWGLGGEHWQRHRSGWIPQDFPGWAITPYDIAREDINWFRKGFVAVSP